MLIILWIILSWTMWCVGWEPCICKQLSLNDNENNFYVNFNNDNNKKTVSKLHDAGWENGYFTSADIAMLVHGCSVSQYPQLYDQQPENYQLLPHPYLGSFEGNNE